MRPELLRAIECLLLYRRRWNARVGIAPTVKELKIVKQKRNSAAARVFSANSTTVRRADRYTSIGQLRLFHERNYYHIHNNNNGQPAEKTNRVYNSIMQPKT